MTNSIFSWEDPFNLEAMLTHEERLIRDSAKHYAKKSLNPRVQQAFREETVDTSIFLEMGRLGFLGATLEDYDCPGVNAVSYGLIAKELESVDSAYRSMMSVQSSLVMYPIYEYGSEAQKNTLLPALAKGQLIGCFGLTEPEAGSDPASMTTHAVATDNGFLINGGKTWITNAPIADIFVIWAKLKVPNHKSEVRGFIVDRKAIGLTTNKITGKLSLRASITGEVSLDNVEVGKEAILPKAHGLKAPMTCLNNARFGIAWGALGAAECCWKTASDYVQHRYQFGRPLAATQLVQTKLANMQTDIALGLLACLRAAQLKDLGQLPHETVSLIKRNACGKALEIARGTRDILGANGITDDYPVMRHMINLETVNTYEGTFDIHGLILGRAITGHSAF